MCSSSESTKSLFERLALVQPNAIFMRILENESCFCFRNKETITVTLPVGSDLISTRYFKHTPPTYDEIEYAINYIEDEIEKAARSIPADNHPLVTDSSYIREIARLCGVEYSTAMHLSRDALEYLFGQYAEIAMGRPPRRHESDISPRFYAQLLIFREFMHHLKFDHVTVIDHLK